MGFLADRWRRLRVFRTVPLTTYASKRPPLGSGRRLRLEPLEERALLAVDLVSIDTSGVSGERASGNSVVTRDGRYVVFESTANDLVAGDNNAANIVDLFRRDTQTGVTELVSRSIAGTGGGNASSGQASISADGRYVAFASLATDLQSAIPDNNGALDVFVRDMVGGTVTAISRSVTQTTGNGASSSPSIAQDGIHVAFQTLASDLIGPGLDTNNASDVFRPRRDFGFGMELLSSSRDNPNATANGASTNPVMSGRGNFVAFVSTADDLAFNVTDDNGVADVYVTGGAGSELVSSRFGNHTGSGNGPSGNPSITDDGQRVAFTSTASNIAEFDTNAAQDVFVHLVDRGTRDILISEGLDGLPGNGPSGSPFFSGGGSRVAFTSAASNLVANDTNGSVQDVFIGNIRFDDPAVQLVSVNIQGNGSGNGASSDPVITSDGAFVAYSSVASNLVPNDSNGAVQDVFRRSVGRDSLGLAARGATRLVSANAAGNGSGSAASGDPVISDNGQTVAFASSAMNLVNNDANGLQDVFRFNSGTADLANQIIVSAPDEGGGPHIRVFRAVDRAPLYDFFAYNSSFTGGVRVATADVNGDSVPDIITAAGPGGGPHVRVFDGANPGQPLAGPLGSFFAYADFNGGVYVAAADFDGDNLADIVTGADAGGGPHVRVFSAATGNIIRDFYAYAADFTGGVRVAAADINADGLRDLITASGPGMAGNFTVYDGISTSVLSSVLPYSGFAGGVYISAGDLDGDFRADIITGAGSGGGPHVRGFSGLDNSEIFSRYAYHPFDTHGVRVASVDADGQVNILTTPGPPHVSNVRILDTRTGETRDIQNPYGFFPGGVFAAGSVSGPLGGSPLRAAAGARVGLAADIDDSVLEPLVRAAICGYVASGIARPSIERLLEADVRVGDLPGDLLGLAHGDRVTIDIDAAGHGWFVDATPSQNEEFVPAAGASLLAVKGPAANRIDLLTVLAHELGHLLGLDDLVARHFADDLMADTLPSGTRRLPRAGSE